MNKFIFRKKAVLFFVFLVSSFFFFFINLTSAADETIVCDNGGCSANNLPLFNELNALPGDIYSKTIEVQNKRDKDVFITLSASKQSVTDEIFLDVIEVKTYFDSILVSTKSLRDFLDGALVSLGNLNVDQNKIIEISMYFDKNADNRYQGKKAVFDIFVNITGDDIETIGDGDSDGGGGGATSVTATTAVLGETSPLVLGAKKFFEDLKESVRDILDEGKIDQQEVLGATCDDDYYRWWIPLIIQMFLSLVLIYLSFKDKIKFWTFLLIELLLCLLSQVVHEILGCNCATGIWCPRYIYINLAITIFSLFLYWVIVYKNKPDSLEEPILNN